VTFNRTTMEEAYNYSDVEDNIEEDEEQDGLQTEETILDRMMQSYDWAAVLGRIKSHPHECRNILEQGRTPLHIACDHDAPAVVVQAFLKAYPEASLVTGTANMNPLHITCSSHHASVHVVRMLLELGRFEQFSMRDVDGDTPLHAACRCGASQDLIEMLLRAYPSAVTVRDYEGLTPLLRLWVRYFVILGEDVIESVKCAADLQGELLDAWKKTERLLQCAHLGSLNPKHAFLALHAASAVDCPRSIVKIAARVHPQQLNARDEEGRTPLMIACQTPVYAVRDLSDDGYTLEDVIHGDVVELSSTNANEDALNSSSSQPSVIEILLQANTEDDCAHGGASLTIAAPHCPGSRKGLGARCGSLD
jgi:Ankyrin repeats (3 copies)